MTLEAAVVLPVFVTIVLAALFFFRLAVIEITLQRVADNAVQQTAVALYPLREGLERSGGLMPDGLEQLAELAPDPVRSALASLVAEHTGAKIVQPVLETAFAPVVRQFVPDGLPLRVINPERLTVEDVELPYLHGPDAYMALTVRYEMALNLPFYTRSIVIRKSSCERVWFGA